MPIMGCTVNGKPGFKFGKNGKCYTYTPSRIKTSRNEAIEKAKAQGRAIKTRKKS